MSEHTTAWSGYILESLQQTVSSKRSTIYCSLFTFLQFRSDLRQTLHGAL